MAAPENFQYQQEREASESKLALLGRLYDEGASLARIVREVGTDDDSLRLIRGQLGVAMSTLRRVAAEV